MFRVISAASVMARCLRSPDSCIVTAARTTSEVTAFIRLTRWTNDPDFNFG
ncbi:hypothetical protein ACFQ9Z_33080 [Streptomyces sp. NPDC056580]|uniref:hypothetical protein n=1 Tax=Streptomyces sp. NPDC056580 TaxID=3345872 RepID=UPI00369F9BF2